MILVDDVWAPNLAALMIYHHYERRSISHHDALLSGIHSTSRRGCWQIYEMHFGSPLAWMLLGRIGGNIMDPQNWWFVRCLTWRVCAKIWFCGEGVNKSGLTCYTWNFRLCEIIARSWNNTFFCCLVYFLLFSKNNAVSCLGFWLLGNACQPDLFLRFLDGKLRFLDGKLCRFKFLSAPLWEVQVPQNGPKPKNARRQKKMQVPQKSNNFWKSKILTSFGRSRYYALLSETAFWTFNRIRLCRPEQIQYFKNTGSIESKLVKNPDILVTSM